MTNDQKYKATLIGLAAVSAFFLGYALKKKKSTVVGNKKKYLEIAFRTYDPLEFSGGRPYAPAMALQFIADENDFVFYALERPPQNAVHEQHDSEYNKFMRSRFAPSDYIAESDFIALQNMGIISVDFPLDQIVFTRSHNGLNKFMVGYSSPYSQDCSASTDIPNVVRPLWAVSFDTVFNTNSVVPADINDTDLRYYGAKMLFAEGLLTRSNEGCHDSQGLNECDAEKGALMQILIHRLRLKQEKIDPNETFASVFDGPGQRWNEGSAFLTPFNEGPSDLAQTRFNNFYNSHFWQMPNLSLTATNFIHFYAIRNIPSWVNPNNMTPSVEFQNYANVHPIRIGRTIVADNSRTFR
jgi:hypothetical protein